MCIQSPCKPARSQGLDVMPFFTTGNLMLLQLDCVCIAMLPPLSLFLPYILPHGAAPILLHPPVDNLLSGFQPPA